MYYGWSKEFLEVGSDARRKLIAQAAAIKSIAMRDWLMLVRRNDRWYYPSGRRSPARRLRR
jgi:hypothetical protein